MEGGHDLIAGTAWLFAREELDQQLDYLFIDEAGQVSLANTIAMGVSAKNVILVGVHTNMCVLKRSFAIRQMTRWGLQCLLIRDMTDAMYNPEDAPHVTHAKGTELVVEHIEKYWSPTLMSSDLLSALGK